jgi:hypothetical protein
MSDRRTLLRWPARLALLTLLAAPVALAQTPVPDTPVGPPGAPPKVMPDRPPQPIPQEGGSGATLGDQLSRSNGVIQPAEPGVDAGMAQTPPPTGPNSTPVITPPQATSPGGDTKVTPK